MIQRNTGLSAALDHGGLILAFVSWISLMLLRFIFPLFMLMYSCIRCQLSKIATAFCPWIPLCCFSVFPTLLTPSSWIKLQISSLPYSFSSLNHWCSCSHRAWWVCMLNRSLQPICRCVSLSSPPEHCYPLSARRRKHKVLFSFLVYAGFSCEWWLVRHEPSRTQLLSFSAVDCWSLHICTPRKGHTSAILA